MRSAAKKIRKKSQREAARVKRQGAPEPVSEDEDPAVHFQPVMDCPESTPLSPPASPVSQGETDYGLVLDMVHKLKCQLSVLNLDNDNIRTACDALRQQCRDKGVAFGDLTRLVKESLDSRAPHQPHMEAITPHHIIRSDLIDDRGNLRAADIGLTWHGGDTFLHGVRVVGMNDDTPPPPCTPDRRLRLHTRRCVNTFRVICLRRVLHIRRVWRPLLYQYTVPPRKVVRVTGRLHRSSALTTRPSTGRRGSFISRLSPTFTDGTRTAMNVARSCLTRSSITMIFSSSCWATVLTQHPEYLLPGLDSTAGRDAIMRTRTPTLTITELCRLGYPQSSPEFRQELISEQFVRGQSDPELKKYMWVVTERQEAPNPH